MSNTFIGTVIRGDGVGKQFGFPTANLDTPPWVVGQNPGIYAVTVLVRGEWKEGVMCVKDNPWKAEVHIFDYGANLYDEELEVEVIEQVGVVEDIADVSTLKQKIAQDVQAAREVFRS